jgi:hypothetical protein
MARERAELPKRAAGGRLEPGERGGERRDEIANAVARLRVQPVIE